MAEKKRYMNELIKQEDEGSLIMFALKLKQGLYVY